MGTAGDRWPRSALVPDGKVCARARPLIQDRQLELAKISNQQSAIKNHQSTIINLTVPSGWPSFALVPDAEFCASARRLIQDRQLKLAKISNQKSSINNH
jgi:hypothetical protein